MRLHRAWAWPYQQSRRLLMLGLTIYGLQAAAKRPPRCEDNLNDKSLKIFRADDGYHSTAEGIYVFRHGRTYFGALDSRELLMSRMENSASHLKIVADLWGEAELTRILESAKPEEEFERKIYEEVIKHETRSTLIGAARLKNRLAALDETLPLSAADTAAVFALLGNMGRLASPAAAWAVPKLAAGTLRQIAPDLIDVMIQTVRPQNSFIYKAVRVTARLDEPRTFLISAGAGGQPDSTHALVLGALKLLLPNERILSAKSGFLSVVPTADGTPPSIRFFEKGSPLPSSPDP